MRSLTAWLTLAAISCANHTVVSAQVANKKTLTLDGAKTVLAACEAEAKKNNAAGVIAVVDDGGNLIAVHRLDGTFSAGANISIGKARTAAMFKKPTRVFEDIIKGGRTAMVALNDFTPLQGGVPILVGGEVVGAVGVSGASSAQQDEEIAMAGARAIDSTPTTGTPAAESTPRGTVSFFDRDRVAAAFSRGELLFDGQKSLGVIVNASRRDEPGEAESHRDETDVFYIVDGSATIATGGSMIDPRPTSPTETRGKGISGGETRTLSRGDVVIVPRNVPHQFREVQGSLVYFVVKVNCQ